MHRAHDPGAETVGRTSGNLFGSQNPSPQLRATFLGTPRSPWEPRLYGGLSGCQTLNCRTFTGSWKTPAKARQTYCIVVPDRAFRHQYVATPPPLGTKSPGGGPTQAEVRTHRTHNRSMVMTDSPPPSGRSKAPKAGAFALFRPVLFAVGAIGLALGGLVLSHRSNPRSRPSAPGRRKPARPPEPAPRCRRAVTGRLPSLAPPISAGSPGFHR